MLDQSIRDSILRGEVFMITLTSGRIVLTVTEAANMLSDYPGFEIHKIVQTTRRPEYDGFDSRGRMIDKCNNRCLIITLDHTEVQQYCHDHPQQLIQQEQPGHTDILTADLTSSQQENTTHEDNREEQQIDKEPICKKARL
jgi:hypothetical protein